MSLIYRSLQQLHKKQAGLDRERRIQRLEAVSRDMKPIILRSVFLFLAAGALFSGILLLLRFNVQERFTAIQPSFSVQEEVAETVSPEREEAKEPAPEERIQSVAMQPAQPSPPEPVPQIPRQAEIATPPTVERAEPNQDLQAYFVQRAKQNESIASLDQEITRAVRSRNLQKAEDLVQRLDTMLPRDSILTLKWRGILALEQGNYPHAEEMFTRALTHSPADIETKINLIQALLRQGDIQSALKQYEELDREAPQDARVQRLEQFLNNNRLL